MTESEKIEELWKEHFPEFSINGNMSTIFHQALTEFAEWVRGKCAEAYKDKSIEYYREFSSRIETAIKNAGK
jgi:hypothetical protein